MPALNPDLVVADNFLPPATAAALAALGIRVDAVADRCIGRCQQGAGAAAGARWRGMPTRGRALNRPDRRRAGQCRAAVRCSPVSAVVWQSGGIVPGDATLIADLLRRTGFRNLSAARGLGQADVLPLEAMLADPPQVILAAGNRARQ